MVRKKSKIFPERRRSKNASTTSRDGSESVASEEPPGVAGMELPLPASPQASRPGTPEKAGPTQLHCKKLQALAHLIEVLSVTIETSQKILQGSINRGITDSADPIIQMESAALELNNSRLQKAVSEYTSLPPVASPTVRNTTQKTLLLNLTRPTPLPHLHRFRQNEKKTQEVLLLPFP
ncbi:hypothetical protein TNCV_2007241 [Trichonephila clavipes]|nr:hypothetical protein TNCV_2007241 [Trichonephila clavipes]